MQDYSPKQGYKWETQLIFETKFENASNIKEKHYNSLLRHKCDVCFGKLIKKMPLR